MKVLAFDCEDGRICCACMERFANKEDSPYLVYISNSLIKVNLNNRCDECKCIFNSKESQNAAGRIAELMKKEKRPTITNCP